MGVLLLLYWILRDIRGASLGKWALGMEVRDVGGGTSSGGARVFRNLPFGLYGFILVLVGMASLLALIIPPLGVIAGLFGTVAVIGLNFAVIFVEFAMLLITGRRIGDRLAQTIVVRLPPIN